MKPSNIEIKSFTKFLLESIESDLDELLASHVITIENYFEALLSEKVDMAKWIRENVIFSSRVKSNDTALYIIVWFKDEYYKVEVPRTKGTDTANDSSTIKDLIDQCRELDARFIVFDDDLAIHFPSGQSYGQFIDILKRSKVDVKALNLEPRMTVKSMFLIDTAKERTP